MVPCPVGIGARVSAPRSEEVGQWVHWGTDQGGWSWGLGGGIWVLGFLDEGSPGEAQLALPPSP